MLPPLFVPIFSLCSYSKKNQASKLKFVILFLVLLSLKDPYSILDIFKEFPVGSDRITQKSDEKADDTHEDQDSYKDQHLDMTAMSSKTGDDQIINTDSKAQKSAKDTDCREELRRLIHNEGSGYD